MLRLLPVPVLMAALLCQAHAAEVSIHASRQDDALYVEVSAEFEADVHQVWQVLTDYDRLSVGKQFNALIDGILRRKQSLAQRPAAP